MENILETLDLSNNKIKKLNKPTSQEAQVTVLILDDNELQRLDNIDSFSKVQKLSAVRNQLLRMYGVCRLHLLQTLNLAHNGILTIEGLKELIHLKRLCLAGNNIKTIEHLNTNVSLEHLDLSENAITHVTDLSFLKNLKELLLHSNKIGHLRQCDRFLPSSLVTLTLASNNISDLNEISHLVHLTNLNSITFANNPCVNMTGNSIGFDYRPFVINWCMNVRVIDGYVVDAIESLRAEWLYSQGRGRHFRVGDQQELTQYLASVCPLTGETLETEEDRKLRLILSKAQHHQQQLRNQQSNSETPNPSPITRKKVFGAKNSPRLNSSRLSNRSKSPDRMSSSCYGSTNISDSSSLMTQSLDPSMLSQNVSSKISNDFSRETNGIINEKCLNDVEPINSPLQALTKLVPVPESLMSPDYRPSPLVGRINTQSTIPVSKINSPKIAQPVRSPKPTRIATCQNKIKSGGINDSKKNSPTPPRQRRILNTSYSKPEGSPKQSILRKSPSSEEESEICDSKLQCIQMKVEEHRLQKDAEIVSNSSSEGKAELAATCIQKIWRGYYTRNKNKEVQEMFRNLQSHRANQYIQKLATDMESTKAALESERKIQMLQMQAINALWKKVSALQPDSIDNQSNIVNMTNLTSVENAEIVKNLAETCTVLQSQIQQLQGSMQDMIKFMALFSQSAPLNQVTHKENGTGTQTEISAVHTPQGDAGKVFPFQKQTRPSSLPLPVSQRGKKENTNGINQELKQFAGSLVDGVIKTVSETKADCIGTETTEITVTDTDKNNKTDEEMVAIDNSD